MSIDHKRAFTRIELIVVIVALVVSLAVLLPQLRRAARTAKLSACSANLKQVVLAQIINGSDLLSPGIHPSQLSTNDGGTMEYVQSGEMYQHFKRLTNELAAIRSNTNEPVSPKVLVCPSDDRRAARTFDILSNANLSYFLNADIGSRGPPLRPLRNEIALGDRNVTNGTGPQTRMINLTNKNQLGWNDRMHNKRRTGSQPLIGNVARQDGSVETLATAGLQQAFTEGTWWYGDKSRLVIP